MTIDFSKKAAGAFDMIPYINKIFTAFPEKITGVSSTPAADHIFNVPFLKNKLVLFIIQWHNSSFSLEFDVKFKLLLHS
jgi:hypothetical protein